MKIMKGKKRVIRSRMSIKRGQRKAYTTPSGFGGKQPTAELLDQIRRGTVRATFIDGRMIVWRDERGERKC